jgi:hypothetical protein
MATLFDDPDVLRSKLLRERMVQGGGTAESAILANASNVGTNLGYGIARLFGREMPEVQAAEKKQQVMQDVLDSTDADGNPYVFGSLEFYDNVSQKLLDAGFMQEAFQVAQIRNKTATTLQSAQDAELDRELKEHKRDWWKSKVEDKGEAATFSEKLRALEGPITEQEKQETIDFLGDADTGYKSGVSEENKVKLNQIFYGSDEQDLANLPEDEAGYWKARRNRTTSNIPTETGITRQPILDKNGMPTGQYHISNTQEEFENIFARELKRRRSKGQKIDKDFTVNDIIDDIINASDLEEITNVSGFGKGGFYKPTLRSPAETRQEDRQDVSENQLFNIKQMIGDKFIELVEIRGMSGEEARIEVEDILIDSNLSENQMEEILEIVIIPLQEAAQR